MINNTHFDSAEENMRYDDQLIADLSEGKRESFFRFYRWQNRGITQSEKRDIPKDFSHIDHAYRVTGGGVVFHCPGDIVFSAGIPENYGSVPTRLKERCLWFSTLIKNSLNANGIPVTLAGDQDTSGQNIQFCNSYHNPYECVLEGEKICGVALKKTRGYTVFQGVIHLNDTQKHFMDCEEKFGLFFTKGVMDDQEISLKALCQSLKQLF
ncbi:hypothetical protein DID78_06505 [Candidatus Marinamargulisbacteria bacterium SCGC AG-343-D04]|nr:hypothetical protein DID78_06505 [Candidatus Marinamargulisbacteria bacterium SCGC AG-343-D04]